MAVQLGKLIGTGAGSDVYEIGNDKVCKLYKAGIGAVEYEYQKTLCAYENGLPTPKVYEIIEYNGRYGIIMDRIKGASYMSILLSNITECHKNGLSHSEIFYSETNINLIHNTAKILYTLHRKKCELMETAKESLRNSCIYNSYLSTDEKAIISTLIEKLPDGDSVCHGDPNPGNFITQNNQIFVIDWTNCVKGSVLYDLTEYTLLMKYADVSIELPEFILSFIRECKDEFIKAFLNFYVGLSNTDLSGLDVWIIPLLVSKMGGNNSTIKQEALLHDIRDRLRAL